MREKLILLARNFLNVVKCYLRKLSLKSYYNHIVVRLTVSGCRTVNHHTEKGSPREVLENKTEVGIYKRKQESKKP